MTHYQAHIEANKCRNDTLQTELLNSSVIACSWLRPWLQQSVNSVTETVSTSAILGS